MLSLIESAGSCKYQIYIIINNDVTDADKQLLITQVSINPCHTIEFIPIGEVFVGCHEIRSISTATYSRLLIPWLLPQHDKIIFSDVDVIFRTNLESVFNDDLSNYFVAAVPAVAVCLNHNYNKYIETLNLNPRDYCNAGFLIINSKLQREADLRSKYLKHSKIKYQYQDQDIINIVCAKRIKKISPKYCITPTFYELLTSQGTQLPVEFYGSKQMISNYLNGVDCILHYSGPKPWSKFTFAWIDWWNTYHRSIFYDAEHELKISNQILKPSYSWLQIGSIIKRKIINIL